MFVRRIWKYITTFVCALIFLFVCVALRYTSYSRLQSIKGERFFYLYSDSSQARIQKSVSVFECFAVKGESVHFALTQNGKEAVLSIAQKYEAQMQFSEETKESVSYYFYSSKLPGGIFVNGRIVNLHIAVGENRGAVGHPIIFGGF